MCAKIATYCYPELGKAGKKREWGAPPVFGSGGHFSKGFAGIYRLGSLFVCPPVLARGVDCLLVQVSGWRGIVSSVPGAARAKTPGRGGLAASIGRHGNVVPL